MGYDISARDRIAVRELEEAFNDLGAVVEEGKQELDKSSPALDYLKLELVLSKIKMAMNYAKGVTVF